jgi:hypothetical protein
MKKSEEYLYYQVREYMLCYHPDILFHIDFSALKISRGYYRGYNYLNPVKWPKFFIAKPTRRYKGLFLEIVAETSKCIMVNGRAIQNRGSTARTEASLDRLNNLGYKALFIKGFRSATDEIEKYLNSSFTLID